MAKTLTIADGLVVPLAAVTEKIAWLGRTGSGKTYGAMKLAEAMLEAGAQIGVLDPVGVWRALRVPAAAGRSFDVVVFGGLYGDVPLEPGAGELIADVVVDRGLSFVLDVSQFIPSEQQTFARAFAHRFFHRKKSSPSAVHLFLEECQEFIPENPSGREALTLGEFQRLWKLGRNFGIGGSLISQRPQEIAKKALNMSGTLFAFQMTGPQERKAIKSWVADQGVATDIEAVLQKLVVGQPHVESPTFLGVSKTVRILPRVTADLSSTPTVGTAAAARRDLTPIDVAQLRAAMAETVARAKADDPKELRKQIAELQRQIKAVEVQQASRKVTAEIREVSVLTDEDRALLHTTVDVFTGMRSTIETIVENTVRAAAAAAEAQLVRTLGLMPGWREEFADIANATALQALAGKLERFTPSGIPGRPVSGRTTAPVAPRPAQANPKSEPIRQSTGPGVTMPTGQRKVLTALAHYPQGRTKRQVALLSGYAINGGGFNNHLSALRSSGRITGSDVIAITPAGRDALGAIAPLPSGVELQEHWRAQLGKAERAIFDALIAVFPQALPKAALAAAAGYEANGGGFNNALSRLRTLELIAGKGELRASEELF
jgi:hypothetical protein